MPSARSTWKPQTWSGIRSTSRRRSTSRVAPCGAARPGLAPRLLGDESLDHLRIDDRSSVCHSPDCRDELADVVDALLEQVRAALRPCLEERKRVSGLQVLTEHDHANVRMLDAQPV